MPDPPWIDPLQTEPDNATTYWVRVLSPCREPVQMEYHTATHLFDQLDPHPVEVPLWAVLAYRPL